MRRLIVRGALVAALLSTAAYAPRAIGNSGAEPPADVMTRIRQFLGVQPRTVSVGGTRSRGQASVCLLAPGPIQKVGDVSEIQLVQSRPNLVFGTPLNEVEIRSGSTVLWSQLATSKGPIQGRIAWPIAPVGFNQRLELAMRPRGSAGGDWAVVVLNGAEPDVLKRISSAVQENAKKGGSSRLLAINEAVSRGERGIAIELTWVDDASSSNSRQIAALQGQARNGCR